MNKRRVTGGKTGVALVHGKWHRWEWLAEGAGITRPPSRTCIGLEKSRRCRAKILRLIALAGVIQSSSQIVHRDKEAAMGEKWSENSVVSDHRRVPNSYHGASSVSSAGKLATAGSSPTGHLMTISSESL